MERDALRMRDGGPFVFAQVCLELRTVQFLLLLLQIIFLLNGDDPLESFLFECFIDFMYGICKIKI